MFTKFRKCGSPIHTCKRGSPNLYIYKLLLSSADNNRSIYIRDELKKKNNTFLIALEGEDSLGKRVFFGGQLLQKMGLGIL